MATRDGGVIAELQTDFGVTFVLSSYLHLNTNVELYYSKFITLSAAFEAHKVLILLILTECLPNS